MVAVETTTKGNDIFKALKSEDLADMLQLDRGMHQAELTVLCDACVHAPII